jgi:hypothetical protein
MNCSTEAESILFLLAVSSSGRSDAGRIVFNAEFYKQNDAVAIGIGTYAE